MIPRPTRELPPPVPVQLGKLLLVEGETPLHFFEALLQHLQLDKSVEVRSFGGIKDPRRVLRTLISLPSFHENVGSLGLVRDAEEDAAAARQSLNDCLADFRDSLRNDLQTSIFIFPDNTNPGMIETLCVLAFSSDPAFTCVQQYFDCLRTVGSPAPDDIRRAKREAQVFLAGKKDVQLFPGQAAYKPYWPWDDPAFSAVKEFVQGL